MYTLNKYSALSQATFSGPISAHYFLSLCTLLHSTLKMASSTAKPHALLVAYPLQGHVIPAIHLAVKLASAGIAVTFANTESVHHQTLAAHSYSNNHDIFSDARASGLDIRYEVISDGLSVEFDRSLNHDEFMVSLLHNLEEHVEVLVRKLLSGDTPITCMIIDTFFVWPLRIAKKFRLPYVSFWTEPALVFTLYYHMHLLKQHGNFDSSNSKNRADKITYIPGVDEIAPSDLMSYLTDSDTTTVVHRIINRAFEEARGADAILCNTVQELEAKTISALQLEKPFYAIGPIFPEGFVKSKVATSLWTESDCTQWLDSKPAGSVLYVSFGSYAHVSKTELEEIAHGIMDSKINFIWVLRPDIVSSNDPYPLPKEFTDRTREQGTVVTWCCQIEVLTHKSVGGFLTHCGWNSILESIWSEVPLLCFPLLTDQFTNRKLVVQDWRIGIDLGGSRTNVSRNDTSEKINKLMIGKERNELIMRVKEVKETLESAICPNGSSQKNFDCFIDRLLSFNTSE